MSIPPLPVPVKPELFPRLALALALSLCQIGTAWADAAVTARIRALSLQIEQAPGTQSLLLQRAMAYVENNQPELALADIQAAEAGGDPVEAAFAHGILLFQAGDYTSARPYFDRYLQAYPLDRVALDYRARLLRDIGETRLALADYETLLRQSAALDPGYYLATARLMASLPDRGVDEALALLDTRMAQHGPVTSLQRYAIELEKARGNYQGAIDRMVGLDQRLKATAQWQVDIAELLLLAGRTEEAKPFLAVAMEQLQSGRMTTVNQKLLQTAKRLQEQAQGAAD